MVEGKGLVPTVLADRASDSPILRDRPLAIDLYCGLGGWTEGLIAAGWDVIGFDIEQHAYDGERYPAQLVVQDVRTLHGSQFKGVGLIVGSSPCTDYSYMAMPWTRAKAKAAAIRADETGEALRKLNELFDAQFRIQREACAAAGRHIPMVVENVRGAEPWVGRARAFYGSYGLWGDIPALMPRPAGKEAVKVPGLEAGWVGPDHPRHKPGRAFNPAAQGERVREERAAALADDGRKNAGFRFDGSGRSFQSESVARHAAGRSPAPGKGARFMSIEPAEVAEGRKGAGAGAEWFDQNLCVKSSRSHARKAASAKIAKIPFALSSWIGRVYLPDESHTQPTRSNLQSLDRIGGAASDKEAPRILVPMPMRG